MSKENTVKRTENTIAEIRNHDTFTEEDSNLIYRLLVERRNSFDDVFSSYIESIKKGAKVTELLRTKLFVHVDSRDQMSDLLFSNPQSRPHSSFNFAQGVLSLGSSYKQGVIFPITSIFKEGFVYDRYKNSLETPCHFEGYTVYSNPLYGDHISADFSADSNMWWSAYPFQCSREDYISFITVPGVRKFLEALILNENWRTDLDKVNRMFVYDGRHHERETLLGVLSNTEQGRLFLSDQGIDLELLESIDLSLFPSLFDKDGYRFKFKGWANQ